MKYPSRPNGLHVLGTFCYNSSWIVAIPVKYNGTKPLVWTGSVEGKSCNITPVLPSTVPVKMQQHIETLWADRGGAKCILLVSMSESSQATGWIPVPDKHIQLSARATYLKDGQATHELVYQSSAPSFGCAVSWMNDVELVEEKPKRAGRKKASTTKSPGKAPSEKAVRGCQPYAVAAAVTAGRRMRKNSNSSPLAATHGLLFDYSATAQYPVVAQPVHGSPQQPVAVPAAPSRFDQQAAIATYMAGFGQPAVGVAIPAAAYQAPMVAAAEPVFDYYGLAAAAPAPAPVPVQSTSNVLDNYNYHYDNNATAADVDDFWMAFLTDAAYAAFD